MADGFGAITYWGFSPALDFQEKDVIQAGSDKNGSPLNILLIGGGDCRHILKTIARIHRHPQQKINFYVIENNLELYARHMLLLSIALQSPQEMGLQEKTELFLEVYGNSLIRSHSNQFVISHANEFIRYVTDLDYMKDHMPLFDLSSLKYKERDQMEAIFKFWRNTDVKIFNIIEHWDERVRQHLQERYDNRRGAYDWDHSMKLCDKSAQMVNIHEYSQWRNSGIAFEPREGNYDTPNKTMASGLIVNMGGNRIARRGYWGDIVTSPYITFGIECEEESLLKTANGIHVKTSRDISEYNILSLFYELVNNEKYVMPKQQESGETEGAVVTEITEDELEAERKSTQGEQTSVGAGQHDCIAIDDVTIHFLPLNSSSDLHKKSKFHQLFNLVYFSNSMVHLLNSEMSEVFSDKATIILETAKFMLDLKKEQIQRFVDKVTGMATAAGCQVSIPCDPEKDAFAKFTFCRKT